MIFSLEAEIDIPQWQVVASKKSGRQFFLTSSENSCIFGMYFVPAMVCEVSIKWPWYTELNDTIIDGIIQKNQIHPTSLYIYVSRWVKYEEGLH